jgi:hypothetical protein
MPEHDCQEHCSCVKSLHAWPPHETWRLTRRASLTRSVSTNAALSSLHTHPLSSSRGQTQSHTRDDDSTSRSNGQAAAHVSIDLLANGVQLLQLLGGEAGAVAQRAQRGLGPLAARVLGRQPLAGVRQRVLEVQQRPWKATAQLSLASVTGSNTRQLHMPHTAQHAIHAAPRSPPSGIGPILSRIGHLNASVRTPCQETKKQ